MRTSAYWACVAAGLLSASMVLADPAAGPFANPQHVQLEDYFPPVDPELGYDQTVPRPEAVIGHTVGSAS